VSAPGAFRRLATALGVVAALHASSAAPARAQVPPPPADTANPDSVAAREARRAKRAAEAPLFATDSVLRFTLVADLKALGNQRDTLKPRTFRGILHVAGDGGRAAAVPVRVTTRGHYRLRTCGFPPLRLAFDSGTGGTPFARQSVLKLGTHCRSGNSRHEEYVAREYLAYRAHGLVMGPHAFRTRLARVRYVNARDRATADTTQAEEHWGLLIEHDRMLAARLGGRLLEQRNAKFEDIAPDSGVALALFEYFLGNSDWSVAALHNVRLVTRADGDVYAVGYDFDFSGLVDTDYAVPDPRLPIRSVRQRIWRGPCASPQTLAAALAPYAERRAALEALWREPVPGTPAGAPWLDDGYARGAQKWVAEFYDMVRDPADFLRRTRRDTDGCKISN
jgi:hypothetical protein